MLLWDGSSSGLASTENTANKKTKGLGMGTEDLGTGESLAVSGNGVRLSS